MTLDEMLADCVEVIDVTGRRAIVIEHDSTAPTLFKLQTFTQLFGHLRMPYRSARNGIQNTRITQYWLHHPRRRRCRLSVPLPLRKYDDTYQWLAEHGKEIVAC